MNALKSEAVSSAVTRVTNLAPLEALARVRLGDAYRAVAEGEGLDGDERLRLARELAEAAAGLVYAIERGRP